MSILHDTTGDFRFIVREDNKYKEVRFTDLSDIPEDFDYMHMIKFVGNVPPAPHTIEEHEQIALFQREFDRYLRKE